MPYELDSLSNYYVAESPYRAKIESIIYSIYQNAENMSSDSDKKAVEDALYFSIKKRMQKRHYSGNKNEYLSDLVADIQEAEYEFEQVSFSSSISSDTFSTLKNALVAMFADT